MSHRCPNYCHWCPDLEAAGGERQIMPWCGGTIHNVFDMSGCYCVKPRHRLAHLRHLREQRTELVARLAALDIEIAKLEPLMKAVVNAERPQQRPTLRMVVDSVEVTG